MEMSPYGEMVCAGIHECKFLMNCYTIYCFYVLITVLHALGCNRIQIFRFISSNHFIIIIIIIMSTYSHPQKKIQVHLQGKNTLYIGHEMSFSIAGLI